MPACAAQAPPTLSSAAPEGRRLAFRDRVLWGKRGAAPAPRPTGTNPSLTTYPLLFSGGGTIVTPVLALLMPYGQATVLGTSLLAMVAPSAAALLQHARLGNVDWRLAAGLAAGTVVGSAAGSMTALNAPPGELPCPPAHPPLACSTAFASRRAGRLPSSLAWPVGTPVVRRAAPARLGWQLCMRRGARAGMLELAFTVGMLFLGRKTLQTARPHACWNKS